MYLFSWKLLLIFCIFFHRGRKTSWHLFTAVWGFCNPWWALFLKVSSSSVIYCMLTSVCLTSCLTEDNSSTSEKIQKSANDPEASKEVAVREPSSPDNGFENGNCKQVSVHDVLCEKCKELLFQPSVLNCGHGWNSYKETQRKWC